MKGRKGATAKLRRESTIRVAATLVAFEVTPPPQPQRHALLRPCLALLRVAASTAAAQGWHARLYSQRNGPQEQSSAAKKIKQQPGNWYSVQRYIVALVGVAVVGDIFKKCRLCCLPSSAAAAAMSQGVSGCRR